MSVNRGCMTLQSVVLEGIRKFGERPFITMAAGGAERTRTFFEFGEEMRPLVHYLLEMDISGKPFALLEPRRERAVCWIIAGILAGAVLVPVNAALPVEELEAILKLLEPAAIVLPEEELEKRKKELERICGDARVFASETMDSLPASGNDETGPDFSPDDTSLIIYTSGTTGTPKGVMLSGRAICLNMEGIAGAVDELEGEQHLYSILPFYHAYGLFDDVLLHFFVGTQATLGAIDAKLPEQIKKHGCTAMICVPMVVTFLHRMLEYASSMAPGADPVAVKNQVFGPGFRIICPGGAFLDPALHYGMERFGFIMLDGYGMTEACTHVASLLFGPYREGSVGVLHPAIQWKLVDGELAVSGPCVMKGYWKQPEETGKVMKDDWLMTGDLGNVDEEGYFYFTGRRKNLLVASDGENISPERIENDMSRLLKPKEVRIRLGKAGLHADFCFEGEREGLKEALREYNRGRIPSRQIRTYSLYEDGLEKNATGKILRDGGRITERASQYV